MTNSAVAATAATGNNNNNVVSSSADRPGKKAGAQATGQTATKKRAASKGSSKSDSNVTVAVKAEGQVASLPAQTVSTDQVTKDGRDKVFTCGVCARSFGYKHVLQNHERTHTGEKPFKCTACHKR